jgi:hypothetical protein
LKILGIRLSLTALVLPALLPCVAAAQQEEKPIYTFVAEWSVPRAQWNEASAFFEKSSRPVLDRMMADGSIVEWARTVSVVHTENGPTHTLWWSGPTIAGIQRVLGEVLKLTPSPALTGAKHRDRLLRSIVYRSRARGSATGYITLSYTQVQPGKGREWREFYNKYFQPIYEQLLADGTILGYGVDVELVHTEDPGVRLPWVLVPNAEGLDKVEAAFDAAREKAGPEGVKAYSAALAELVAPGTHRDSLDRVVHYVHK